MIECACPSCGSALSIPDIYAGKKGRCQYCKNAFMVPAAPVQPQHAASRYPKQSSSSMKWLGIAVVSIAVLALLSFTGIQGVKKIQEAKRERAEQAEAERLQQEEQLRLEAERKEQRLEEEAQVRADRMKLEILEQQRALKRTRQLQRLVRDDVPHFTLINDSGDNVLIRLIGTMREEILIEKDATITIPINGGRYTMLEKFYGPGDQRSYAKGNFDVVQSKTAVTRITIRLFKGTPGTFTNSPIGESEFNSW